MEKTECSKCGKTILCKETPSGFMACKECWKKYKVIGVNKEENF